MKYIGYQYRQETFRDESMKDCFVLLNNYLIDFSIQAIKNKTSLVECRVIEFSFDYNAYDHVELDVIFEYKTTHTGDNIKL